MKHGILNLLHLTKINERLLVVLPPATLVDGEFSFSFIFFPDQWDRKKVKNS